MVFYLCQTDSKAQHQSPILKNHHSIAVAKSNTIETLDRVFAILGKPFLKKYDLNLFLRQAKQWSMCCLQNNLKSYGQIWMKFSRNVNNDTWNRRSEIYLDRGMFKDFLPLHAQAIL